MEGSQPRLSEASSWRDRGRPAGVDMGGVGEGRRCRHPLGVGITEDRDTELYLGLSGYCAAAPSPPEALLPVGHLAITSFPEQAEGGRGWDRCQRERASGLGGTSPAGPPGRRSPGVLRADRPARPPLPGQRPVRAVSMATPCAWPAAPVDKGGCGWWGSLEL